MAKVFIDETTLTDIADSIREKNGTSSNLDPANFASLISSISTGRKVETGSKTISAALYKITNIPCSFIPTIFFMWITDGTNSVNSNMVPGVVHINGTGYVGYATWSAGSLSCPTLSSSIASNTTGYIDFTLGRTDITFPAGTYTWVAIE